jgi:uncharacterized protein (DUF342 family)
MSEINNNAINQAEEAQPVPPVVVLKPSTDAMQLELILQKVSPNTLKPVYEDVMAAITELGVTAGINEVALKAVCANPMFNYPLIVARGVPPKTGADGYLIYLIETKRELRPKLLDNGNVDYRDIGYIHNVAKGQPLCEIHAPEKGKDGFDIYGKVLEGKLGRAVAAPVGKNTALNEDETLLLAAVDGNAEVVRGVVQINDVLKINGNVDNSTGDVDFVGDVAIAGDVVSGFRVISGGNVTVRGSVEGAVIQATGDIIVNEGINGMNRGILIAGGNLRCKYVQSCDIRVSENIYADSVMYCNTECSGNVELGGKRAVLIGGRSSVAGTLTAKTIGTDSHIATYITMASSGTGKLKEIAALTQEIKSIDDENLKRLQQMAHFDDLNKKGRVSGLQTKMILAVRDAYLKETERRTVTQIRLDEMKEEQLKASEGSSMIVCKGRVHVGVQITFGPLTMTVQNSFENSRVLILDHDIKVMAM